MKRKFHHNAHQSPSLKVGNSLYYKYHINDNSGGKQIFFSGIKPGTFSFVVSVYSANRWATAVVKHLHPNLCTDISLVMTAKVMTDELFRSRRLVSYIQTYNSRPFPVGFVIISPKIT